MESYIVRSGTAEGRNPMIDQPKEMFLAFDGKHLRVGEVERLVFQAIYPHVDILQECRFMDEWLEAHPKRRGTRRFIQNWLKTEERKAARPNPELTVGSMAGADHLAHLAHFSKEEWEAHLDELDPKRKRV
jgi:hypothetical protein